MRCYVVNCKNDSKYATKVSGISFHVFPSDPALNAAWIKAVGKEPKSRSVVCSEHFLAEDLYVTTNGFRKVKDGAVPFILQPTKNQKQIMACRVCLLMDTKLYPIKKHKLKQAYENLTGLTVRNDDKLPHALCVECAKRLTDFNTFKNKSLKSNKLMLDLLKTKENITIEDLNQIDRINNELVSNIAVTTTTDQCDLYVSETGSDDNDQKYVIDNQTDDLHQMNVDVEVKREDTGDIFAANDDFDNKDEVEVESEPEVTTDKDYVASDKDYSTDDSLPLEIHKERVKIKKKVAKTNQTEEKVKNVRKKNEMVEPKIDRRRKPFLSDDMSDNLFTITDLSPEEQMVEILNRKDSTNYKRGIFKCTECFKGFLDEEAFNSHMLRHTDDCGEHQCHVCKIRFKVSKALRKHITAHHTQRFSCNWCSYTTTHRQTARLHARWHNGTKYQCPHCQDEFVKFTTYMGHIRIKHPSGFVCELCGYSFVSTKGIELHKKLKHRCDDVEVPLDGPLCAACDVRFVSAEVYQRHLAVSGRHQIGARRARGRKPKDNTESSDAKDASALRNIQLDNKRRIYQSQIRKVEGPINCEQCGLQVDDSRAYRSHFRRMHPDKNRTNYPSMKSPCMCEVCGRIFQSFALLKDHTWTHTGERPFKCDRCDKSFRMKQRLVAHQRVHSASRAAFPCALCHKHFSTHSNRKRHMFIHTGLKPFKCEMCGKGFKHASEKRAHVNYVHLKKPWPKRTRGKRRDVRSTQIEQNIPSGPINGGGTNMTQPIWPPCEPKMADINLMQDKPPMYYNMKM